MRDGYNTYGGSSDESCAMGESLTQQYNERKNFFKLIPIHYIMRDVEEVPFNICASKSG